MEKGYSDDIQEVPEDWEIENILSKRTRKSKASDLLAIGGVEYYIKWVGYDESYNEWKTKDELFDLGVPFFENLIKQFEEESKVLDKVKQKKKKQREKTPPKNLNKWDQAQLQVKNIARAHAKETRERARIERELADEARRVAAEAERIEEALIQEEARKRAEVLAQKRRYLEQKKYNVLQKLYQPLSKPILEVTIY